VVRATDGASPATTGTRRVGLVLADQWTSDKLAGALLFFFAADASAQENALKAGVGREAVAAHCVACHSLDYLRQNAPFLSRQGWESEVTKMIKAFGAPIEPADAKIIVDYLTANYGGG
jgi:sulfite dehydrogenase (cytochrome) subunit B